MSHRKSRKNKKRRKIDSLEALDRKPNRFVSALWGFTKTIPVVVEIGLRWGIAVLILSLLAGTLSAHQKARNEADQLADELANLENERGAMQDELNLLADPEWRENYWKWRMMRREPGEYYIKFSDPEDL